MKNNRALKKILNELKKNPEIVGVYLFGSYAENNEKPLSDIDVAVILKNITPEIEADIGSMYSDKIDLILFNRLPLHIKFEVFKKGKELFINDEDYILNLKLAVLREYLDTAHIYTKMKQEILK
ncbi:MAG: type VII toxin-antitoxin system MntA family adenylyltransferase antitoxin [Brevinematia bacterium]